MGADSLHLCLLPGCNEYSAQNPPSTPTGAPHSSRLPLSEAFPSQEPHSSVTITQPAPLQPHDHTVVTEHSSDQQQGIPSNVTQQWGICGIRGTVAEGCGYCLGMVGVTVSLVWASLGVWSHCWVLLGHGLFGCRASLGPGFVRGVGCCPSLQSLGN